MKEGKRHISTEKKLIIGIVIAILIFVVSLYICNNHLAGRILKDNVPLFIAAIVVMLMLLASALTTLALIECLIVVGLSNHEAKKSNLKSKEQIKALPSNYVNVHFKDFDEFLLADFVSSEDITCVAKLDENRKVVYSIQLNVEYETDDYELFLKHFDV